MPTGMEMDQYRAIINLNRSVDRLTLLYEYKLLTQPSPHGLTREQSERRNALRQKLWPSKRDTSA